MATKNLFAKAKSTAEPKKKSKDEKVRVNIDSYDEENGLTVFEKMAQLSQADEDLKVAKAKSDTLKQEIREIGKSEWLRMQAEGKNPGSFMLEATKGLDTAQTMFLPVDKYASIKTEEEANILKETFGDDIVEEKTEFKFNAALLEKYSDVISDLISNSTDIKEIDKEKIIEAVVTFSIKKGVVENPAKYGDAQTVIETVRPEFHLKGTEVIKG